MHDNDGVNIQRSNVQYKIKVSLKAKRVWYEFKSRMLKVVAGEG